MNLQSLCLDTIANNLGKYIKNKDVCGMREDLEYLKRIFPLELLARLEVKNNLKEQFTDMLLSKHIKTLDTKWIENYSWDKVVSKIAEIGYNIEELLINKQSCSRTSTIKPWHNLIRYFPNLKRFTLREGCYDDLLENVAKFCANIEDINIVGRHQKLAGVKYLCQDESGRPLCRNLKRLYNGENDIKEEDLKYLVQKLPSLREISGGHNLPRVLYSLHKEDLLSLDKVKPYKFTELEIDEPESEFEEDFFKICLALCPNLKYLTCRLSSKKQLDYLSSYLDAKVEDLWLYSPEQRLIPECNINNFLITKGEKINCLQLEYCSVSASVLSKSCPRLETLEAEDVRFCFEDDSTIEFHSLNEVILSHHLESEDDGVCRLLLSLSKQLKSIELIESDLPSSKLQESFLQCCEQNPVESLNFSGSRMEMEFLKKVILRCHALNYLNVADCFEESELEDLLEFLKTRPNKIEVVTEDDLID